MYQKLLHHVQGHTAQQKESAGESVAVRQTGRHAAPSACLWTKCKPTWYRTAQAGRTAVPRRLAHHLLVQVHLGHALLVARDRERIHLLHSAQKHLGSVWCRLLAGLSADASGQACEIRAYALKDANCASSVNGSKVPSALRHMQSTILFHCTCTQPHSLAVSSSWKIARLRFIHVGATCEQQYPLLLHSTARLHRFATSNLRSNSQEELSRLQNCHHKSVESVW